MALPFEAGDSIVANKKSLFAGVNTVIADQGMLVPEFLSAPQAG
jgi:hypothetical protein